MAGREANYFSRRELCGEVDAVLSLSAVAVGLGLMSRLWILSFWFLWVYAASLLFGGLGRLCQLATRCGEVCG